MYQSITPEEWKTGLVLEKPKINQLSIVTKYGAYKRANEQEYNLNTRFRSGRERESQELTEVK